MFLLFLYVLVNFLIMLRKDNRWRIVGPLASALLLIYFYTITGSRAGVIAGFVAIFLYLFRSFSVLPKILNKIKVLILLLPSLLLAASLIITVLYSVLDLKALNATLSNRLELQKTAYETWGITIFGNNITYIGQSHEAEVSEEYNYIDNSFLHVLFNCGALYLVALLAYLALMTKRLYSNEEYFLISVFIVFLIYCSFDSWLFAVMGNILLLYNNSGCSKRNGVMSTTKAKRFNSVHLF